MAKDVLAFDVPREERGARRGPHRSHFGLRWDALFFGVSNVLCDATLWRRWLCRTLSSLGYEADFPDFFRPWDYEYLPDIHTGRRRFRSALAAFFCQQGMPRPLIEEFTPAAMYRLRIAEEQDKPFLGVRQTLLSLADMGLTLGVVEGQPFGMFDLRAKLLRLGLSPTLSTVVPSIEHAHEALAGSWHAAALHAALAQTGVRAKEAAFFGGDPLALKAARCAGMATISYRHLAQLSADEHVTWFADLPSLCRAGSLRQSA